MYFKRWILLLLVVSLGAFTIFINSRIPPDQILPVKNKFYSPSIIKSTFWLKNLTLGAQGYVLGSRGKWLYQINQDGQQAERLYEFEQKITAIYQRKDGLLIVATNNNYWDEIKPSFVFRSKDQGQSFEQVKKIEHGTPLKWSISADKAGRIYLAEYGPQKKDMSKTLWRSDDDAESWQIIYQAENKDNTHLHRVAVDPYTDYVWLTVGDGKNRQMLKSEDHGDSWQKLQSLQSTSVVFTKEAIYWGKDKKSKPGVIRYDRASKKFKTIFKPQQHGNYGGSIYDMLGLNSDDLIVPFKKYPDQDHIASVWHLSEGEWSIFMQLASNNNKGAGFSSIAGPDKDGWIYVSGYQFKEGL